MPDERAAALRATASETLGALLAQATALFEEALPLVAAVEAKNDEWIRIYNSLELSSASFPFAPYHNYYYKNFEPRREPLFRSHFDGPSENFFEISQAEIDKLQDEYVAPAFNATEQVFSRAKALFVRAASQVVIVRRLNGYDDLLQQLGVALKLPWAADFDPKYRNYSQSFPGFVDRMTIATPFHRSHMAVREANAKTLRIVHDRLQSLVAVLSAMLTELEFADMLAEPTPVPQTLIMLMKVDNSTNLGEGASVKDSAIGSASTRSR